MLVDARRFARAGFALAAMIVFPTWISTATPAQAGGETELQEGVFWDPNFDPRISMGVAAGQMDVTGREFVYDAQGGNRISQLDYLSHQVGIIGAHFGVEFTPWLSAAIKGNVAFSGDSESNDLDWIDPISYDYGDWTHYYNSPDANFDALHQLEGSARLELFRHPNFEFGALIGYKWDHFGWTAKGGHFIYSSTDDNTGERIGYRDKTLDFAAGAPVLSFEQDYLTPYIGLAVDGHLGPVTLSADVKYSQWAQVDMIDKHYLRTDLGYQGWQARDDVSGGEMFSWRVAGSYAVTEDIALTAEFERQSYGELVGQQRRTCIYTNGNAVGDEVNCPQQVFGAGSQATDNTSQKYMLGLTYKLH